MNFILPARGKDCYYGSTSLGEIEEAKGRGDVGIFTRIEQEEQRKYTIVQVARTSCKISQCC
jgi:hypothetical protein